MLFYETSISVFDQYSVAHIAFGVITFLLLIMILGKFGKRRDSFILLITFLLTFIIAIGWEIFENSPFIVSTILKWNSTKDSFLNSTTDIILNMIGATIVLIIFWYIFKKTNVRSDLIRFKKKIIR